MFSIITVTLNSELYLFESVSSVLNQKFSDFELIVQDGGSSDQTLNILNCFDDSRISVNSEKDSGLYDAMNRAIDRCTGEVVGIMHSDDLYFDNEVLKKVAVLFDDPKVDAVYGDLVYVDRSNVRKVVRFWKAGLFAVNNLRSGWMPPHPTLFVRREKLIQFGKFDPSFRISGDYNSFLRMAIMGRLNFHYIPHILVRMRVGGVSNNGFRSVVMRFFEDWRAVKMNGVGGIFVVFLKIFRKLHQFLGNSKL